jgi:hypothetical protein
MADCEHVCCDHRNDGSHIHAVEPVDCRLCETVRETGGIPPVSLDNPVTSDGVDKNV